MTRKDLRTTMPQALARPVLRPLGAFENVIDLYISRNPVQFSLTVELASAVSATQLDGALAALQRAHPLLAVAIDRTGERPVFRASPEPIPVRTVRGGTWPDVSASEQSHPIDVGGSPLVRATLLLSASGDRGTVVILTFSHQVADGRGALRAVHDLVAALDGRTIPTRPVPDDQESLLERLPDTASPEPRDQAPSAGQSPGSIRPFDGAAPHVESAELDAAETARLLATAHVHSSTVQGALCAAAAQSLSATTGVETVRINVPVDLRSALDLEDDVVNRFTATTVVLQPTPGCTLWPLARTATRQLRAARDTARETALVLAHLTPSGPREAEAAMLAATTADLEITNLGVSEPDSRSALAIWGPTMTTQVVGEQILGVTTHAGSLRMALTTHGHGRGLAADIAERLARL